jgi:hypothetical protein
MFTDSRVNKNILESALKSKKTDIETDNGDKRQGFQNWIKCHILNAMVLESADNSRGLVFIESEIRAVLWQSKLTT